MRPVHWGILGALLLAACGGSERDSAGGGGGGAPDEGIALQSVAGCRLDGDCAEGLFCFRNACVRECGGDEDCPGSSTCSLRSRCVSGEVSALTVDESEQAVHPTRFSSIAVRSWPSEVVRVEEATESITVTLETEAPLPGGALPYRVEGAGADEQLRRASGSTRFELVIPTGGPLEAGEARSLRLHTPMGSREIHLLSGLPRSGSYGGTFTPAVFGGSGLPLDFAIETVPPTVSSLSEAEQAWLWIPASAERLVSLPLETGGGESWIRAPLVWEDAGEVWVATFARTVPLGAYGLGEDRSVRRSLRVEVSAEDEGVLRGALADRWEGLFEKRSADGIRTIGTATVSGTFLVTRHADLPRVEPIDATLAPPHGETPPLPDLSLCTPEIFAQADEDACGPIDGSAAFAAAKVEHRAPCALAVADRVFEGESLQEMLFALLDPDQPNPRGLSFREFVEACAADGDPLCEPTDELLCARGLVAHAYRDVEAAGDRLQELAASYDRLTREAFLGRQLAAFHVDTQSRLSWLQASEAPPFLASTLREHNEQILRVWRAEVLEAHLDGLFGQLDAAGLSVLARSTTDADALSRRRALLMEVSNSWRAATDALAILASRWNVLHQGEVQRARAAEEVRQTAFRLYVGAVIVQELSQELGASYLTSTFGAGFAALLQEVERLSLPFDELIFARDAEVVASRSLDPQSDSRSLLGEMEESARAAVADAAASVDLILDEAQRSAVDEATLTAQYEDQLLSLRNELIELCGLPEGCSASDVGVEAACNVPTGIGRCGFLQGGNGGELELPQPDGASVSAAGGALLAWQAASLAWEEARQELVAHAQRSTLTGATVEAFAQKVEEWDRRRRAVAKETELILSDISKIRSAALAAELSTLEKQQALRVQAYESQRAAVERWNEIRLDGVKSDMKVLGDISSLNIASSALNFGAQRADLMTSILKGGLPQFVGAAFDMTHLERLFIRSVAFGVSTVTGTIAQALDGVASKMEVQLARQQALRSAEMSHLQDLNDLGAQLDELQISELETRLRSLQIEGEQERAMLQALIDSLKRNLELDLAHDRDLLELRDRRDAWLMELVGAMGLEYQVAQAELTVRQKEMAYFQIVQQAQLLEGRYRNMLARWQNLEQILGSPDVLFSFANRMARAESRLDRARRALEDWLVALEYYAVRPFVNERMAILLARNPSQLEAIANEMSRLQMVCGGPQTLETVDVSLRDDLLRLGFSQATPEGPEISPAERFRALLARAESGAPGSIPYTSEARLGEVLDRESVWAVDFNVDVEAFANLGRTCNAKIDSVAVRLVGEGLGTGQPVVALVHHGASQLRSCQPGIRDYVAQFGADSTAFGPVTAFRTAGRMIAPVAGIDGFGPALSWNRTLEGIPFASTYTLVVDRAHPSNEAIDWDAVEDIRLQFRFTYQDVFPKGQCE